MTIKEVEQCLEVPRATVRFYEKEGLINPQRGENGYREYSDEDVQTLKKIIILRKLGLAVADIEDVLDGARPMSEVVAGNISNLEKQIEELQGALKVCHRLQDAQEEIETFDVDKYWNVIEEEEQKGNRFLDIAKDVVHFEKATFLEHFGIADVNGNLSVSVPKAILMILIALGIFGCCGCIAEGDWNLYNFGHGVMRILAVLLLELIVGVPVYFVSRKHPEILKNKAAFMLKIYLGLLVFLIALVMLVSVLNRV